MLCLSCQRPNRDEARFCDHCGGTLRPVSLNEASPTRIHAEANGFVGRATEIVRVAKSLDESLAGNGQIVMVAGEPGIGKTRLATRVAAEAKARGMPVLWGRCKEEPGAPPYWPWLQAIDAHAHVSDDDALRTLLGRGATHIAAISTCVADRFPNLSVTVRATDPDQARFQLFDALTAFWKRVAGNTGLLIILDNLHAADTASLRFLEFLAAEIANERIMLLGTYRDIELSRRHPLSNTLGELVRHAWVQRLRLGGLTLDESAALVKAIAGSEAPRDLLRAIFGQTEGNPLFLQEMTRYLAHEGMIERDRRPASGSVIIERIPEGIREVIGTRLNRLSETCNQVLAAAAVIGRAFRLDLLTHLDVELTGENCLTALEEAQAARIVEGGHEPGTYEFTHALIRETLYDELPGVQRSRLHQRIATMLAAGEDTNEMATLAAIAHHSCAALPGGDAVKALEFAWRAAERADALYAYEEAAALYRLALQALDAQGARDAMQRARLLVALGDSLTRAGEHIEARDTFRRAAEAAQTLEAPSKRELFARAAIGFEDASFRPGGKSDAAVELLRASLDFLGPEDTTETACVLSALTRALIHSGNVDMANDVNDRAIAMARRLGDPATLSTALTAGLGARWLTDRLEVRIANGREGFWIANDIGDEMRALDAISQYAFDILESGDFALYLKELGELRRRAKARRSLFQCYVVANSDASIALFQGLFSESAQLADQALALGERLKGIDALGVYGMQMFTIRRAQGRLREVASVVRQFIATTPTSGTWRPGLTLIYAELDMRDHASREFDLLAANEFSTLARDALWITSISYLAETCVYLDDADRAATLYRLMLPYRGRNLVTGSNIACLGSADRHLGMLAATMKRWNDADAHFTAAIAMNARNGGLPWLALSQYEHARMLVARNHAGDRERGATLAEQASAIAETLGMARLTEQLAHLRQGLGDPASHATLPAGISAREAEVLRLVAIGRSNKEIARVLSLSDNTVANHVRNILAKTGTANRTEAAAFARENRLA